MDPYNLPVAKRTRLQKQLGFNGTNIGFSGSRNRSSKRNKQECHEVIDVDDEWIENIASETTAHRESDDKFNGLYGSASPFKTGTRTYFVYSDESDKEETDEDLQTSWKRNHGNQNNTKAGLFLSSEDESFSSSESEKNDFDLLVSISNKAPNNPTANPILVLDISDSDEHEDIEFVNLEELEDSDVDLPMPCAYDHGSQMDTKASSFQSATEDDEDEDEDELFSSSESESDDSDDADFSLVNKRPHQPTRNNKEHVWSRSAARKVKSPSVHKTNMEATYELITDESSDSNVTGKQNAQDEVKGCYTKVDTSNQQVKNKKSKGDRRYDENNEEQVWSGSVAQEEESPPIDKTTMKTTYESIDTNVIEKQCAHDKVKGRYTRVDQTNTVKNKKSKFGRRDNGSCIEEILNSIVVNKEVHSRNVDDPPLPLFFRFEDSEDESSIKTDEYNGEELFQEMEFAFKCDEIGYYGIPMIENQEKDECYDDTDLCNRGKHGDIYFEEQIGLRCCLCGAVLVESKDVIPKLASYAPDKSKRSRRFDDQFYISENPYSMDSDSIPHDICKQTKGTVWELIPTSIRARMYPHQQEGFEFLWSNLAGTIELSRLQTLGPRCDGGGGGCIISHAPGTGKTFLTIVFIESFLKKFPNCCPVIVAPASMLLTWEAEFKKWQVGISFINLHNNELLRKEVSIGSSSRNKDWIRASKIRAWSNGGSVLGISYSLYEKLAGDSNIKKTGHEKIRTCLLDMPGLVVLDEGHTPRNEKSKIWNTLLKLETKNRVILSGTPFQNNFRELFNTLRIVRPATAKSIVKKKFFADMIQRRHMKRFRGRSTSEDIEKLKEIISPFVHVHKGHILESKLPGLKRSVILLNPPPFQKSFIENLGNLPSTWEYEHKVALVSVHPSLILHCSLSKNEENSINKQQLEDVRLQPEVGVKTRFVIELIRLSLSLNEKVLIFSQYIHPSQLLKDQIAHAFGWDVEKEVMIIKGKMHQTHRQNVINAFNDPNSDLKVLLASTKCCSEGIHLYGASRVVLLDVVWNPSVEKQAISRAYRLGQKKVVYTYHLMAAGTTEEEKYDRQVEKWRLAEMVFSSASVSGGEPKNKANVDDKILLEMVDNQELKDMFKKIRYPENQTRI